MALAELTFTVGQVVYAKLKGYLPWPALITHIPKKTIARVAFFNSTQWSELSFKKLIPYHSGDAKAIVNKHLNRNAAFTKAHCEMLFVTNQSKPKVTPTKAEEKIETKSKSKPQHPRIILDRLSVEAIKELQEKLSKKKSKHFRKGRNY